MSFSITSVFFNPVLRAAAGSPSGQAGAADQGAAARQGPVGQMSAVGSSFGRRQAGKTGVGGSLASIASPVGKSDVPAAFKK